MENNSPLPLCSQSIVTSFQKSTVWKATCVQCFINVYKALYSCHKLGSLGSSRWDGDYHARDLFGSVLGTNNWGRELKEAGWIGEEVICNAVLVEVSANRLGSSEVGLALQSCPDLVVGDRSLLSSHWVVIGCKPPLEEGLDLEQSSSLQLRPFTWGPENWGCFAGHASSNWD